MLTQFLKYKLVILSTIIILIAAQSLFQQLWNVIRQINYKGPRLNFKFV